MRVLSSTVMATLMATATADAAFASPSTFFQFLPSQRPSPMASSHLSINSCSKSATSTSLLAYRERSNYDQNQNRRPTRSSVSDGDGNNNRRRRDDNAFGDFDDDNFEDSFDDRKPRPSTQSQFNNNNNANDVTKSSAPSTFYSKKTLTDPSFSPNKNTNDSQFFQHLCSAAKITRPSRIQSLAWPPLLRGENTIVADQTGSGKTLAYLLPLLQKLHQSDVVEESDESSTATQRKKNRTGAPRVVVLTPTAELADQIYGVCTSLSKNLGASTGWSFNPFVTTATGSHSTNIRDQIRMLQSTPVDVLISTPGRLSTILRTKSAGLDLGHVASLVLDEVDFLLVDETFGPQLRTVGVAVQGGGDKVSSSVSTQSIFVTATLPEDVLESIQDEFPNVTQLRGPGLHRITPSVHQTLVDVSVPADMNRDKNACFDIKVREMLKSLRARRCNKTLIFCNTVETCRSVENVLRRKDRKGRRNRVWAYHNALSAEVRLKNLQQFSSDEGSNDVGVESILVCTDRAARGIDFDASPIDHVVLFDFPKDPAEYVRRVGRTARAGRTGASTVLAYGWQLPIARQITGQADSKGKKGKGNAKLESFTMMKSNDGWDDDEKEDEYYIKGGARKRKEASGSVGKGGSGKGGGGGKNRKNEKPKMWKK
mmetsp:Transcript_7346/g.16647  ORF Transcript_7346/g.16647 Transcript_7346/m.16647 type:complete len:654 (-) Transcript_7346:34-1995(-)